MPSKKAVFLPLLFVTALTLFLNLRLLLIRREEEPSLANSIPMVGPWDGLLLTKKSEMNYTADIERPNEIYALNDHILPTQSYFGNNFSPKLKNICQKDDPHKSSCVASSDGISPLNAFVSTVKIGGCLIQKNSNLVLNAIFCYLWNIHKYSNISETNSIPNIYTIRNTSCPVNYHIFPSVKSAIRKGVISSMDAFFKDWTMIAIVRHPIERFISGFVDKCYQDPITDKQYAGDVPYCNGCRSNLTCFVIKEYEKMITQSKNRKKHVTAEDWHFFPQNWICSVKKWKSNLSIVKYTNLATVKQHRMFVQQLMAVLEKSPLIPKPSLDYIRRQLFLRTAHFTVGSKAYQFVKKRIGESPFLMELLIRMFYWDFKLLNFPIPDVYHQPVG